MSTTTWNRLEHGRPDCRGAWQVELQTEQRWDDDETKGMRAICATCGVVHNVYAWSRATDDHEAVEDYQRPRLSHGETPLADLPESVTEKVAGMTVRGSKWGWGGARDPRGPELLDVIADGRVVGRLQRTRGPRGGEQWWWAALDSRTGRVSGCDQGAVKSRTAAVRAILAALAAVPA